MKPRISDEELRQMVEDRCLDSQTCKRCRALLDLRDLRAKVREVLEIHGPKMGSSGPLEDLIELAGKGEKT